MSTERPSRDALYHDLFDRLLDSVVLLDSERFTVLESNETFERTLGLKLSEVLGRSILDFIEEGDRVETEKALRIARRRHYPRSFEVHWHSGGNRRKLVLEFLACVLKLQSGGEVIQVIARDVTPLREAESRAERYLAELKEANTRLQSLSVTDELTGLFNIRHFRREIAKEQERGERYGQSYALVFIDVDHFKHLNDKLGHPAGDAALRELAMVLRKQVRNTDLVARYGGEEFVILCPGVNWEGAKVLAERVRVAVESAPITGGAQQPGGKLTVSIGISSFPADGRTMEEVLQAADDAVYASKQAGRNQITAAAESVATKASKKAVA